MREWKGHPHVRITTDASLWGVEAMPEVEGVTWSTSTTGRTRRRRRVVRRAGGLAQRAGGPRGVSAVERPPHREIEVPSDSVAALGAMSSVSSGKPAADRCGWEKHRPGAGGTLPPQLSCARCIVPRKRDPA